MARKAPHPKFIEYMHFIANHENYSGMPDLLKDDGGIQWETPSNRLSGKHKDSHQKRLGWWRKKAIEVGIDVDSAEWISKTAKLIHPTKHKPCSVCGKIMDLRYGYPSAILLARIRKLKYSDDSFKLDSNEHINDLLRRLTEKYGNRIYADLGRILKTGKIVPPELPETMDAWLRWINDVYISLEPITLSPGSMSNAPDRLDGFHTYNRCCRPQEDTGRTAENLRTYSTDRRVFMFWNQGDWIAADRLAGKIRANFRNENCLNGHPGPCDADHIGPLSLGFNHRPEYQLLCSACNSAKNNRMSLNDVEHLKSAEIMGEEIISWHSKALWDKCKERIVDDETALRMSKLLRDNRHTLMDILRRVAEREHYVFLACYLELDYANYDINFENLRIENHVTRYDNMIRIHRGTKYTVEQKARRCRIAFESLAEYYKKQTRNTYVISNSEIASKIMAALRELDKTPENLKALDVIIGGLVKAGDGDSNEDQFKRIIEFIPDKSNQPPNFCSARASLEDAMRIAAEELNNMWNQERYVRATDAGMEL